MQTEAKSRAQFYMGTVQDEAESIKLGRPIFKDTPCVKIYIPGDQLVVIDQPVWDDPMQKNSHTSRFPTEWAAFKANAAQEVSGTPLEVVPWITKAQVLELQHFHVRTVEDLAGLADVHASKFMGIQKLKSQAHDFLERAKGAAPDIKLRAELEKRDNVIDTLQKQVAELAARVAESKKVK